MNETLNIIFHRKSIRAFENRAIADNIKGEIIRAALRAPTAGNLMLYTIIDVADQNLKEQLVKTCDNQPFIAKAPLVLLFLADFQRIYDYYLATDGEKVCKELGVPMRTPQQGDLFLACCDALIAAQNSVIAAESLGLGSCYIGDIMENYEIHRKLFDLPRFVFPITLLCIGYPTDQQKKQELTPRFDARFIVHKNSYKQFSSNEILNLFDPVQKRYFQSGNFIKGADNIGQHFFLRKFVADFAREMNRSVRVALENWKES